MTDPRRPRLLVLTSTFPATAGDGVPAFVLDIAKQEALDFDVTVLTPRTPGGAPSEIIAGVAVERFAYFPRRFEKLADGAILDNLKASRAAWLQVIPFVVAQYFAVRRLKRRLKPDAIHAHWTITQGVVASLAAPRIPMMITTHGGDVYALNNPIARAIKKFALGHARSLTTVNGDMAERIEGMGVDADRIHVLSMGVPLDEAKTASAATARVDNKLVVVGRLVEKKGFEYAIEALRRQASGDPLTLTVVGDGPLRGSLEHAAAGAKVEFLGQLARAEVLETMGSATIFLVPSVLAASGDREGLPVVLLEAAAMGCAIIASDLPGINEALTDHVNAILVPPGDVQALAAAITELMNDPALRARLGRAALERADDYSLDRIGGRFRGFLAEMLTGSAAEPPRAHG